MRNGRHVTTLQPSRDLCGTTPLQFAELLLALSPHVETVKNERLLRDDRKRAPGAGKKSKALQFRLFVALTHLKQGNTVRANGDIFGVHEKTVRRYRDELEALLVAHGFKPPGVKKPIRSLEDLKVYLENSEDQLVIVDGTEVERSSPKAWDDQRKAWSGKCHGHTVKGTMVADRKRRPLWFEANPSHEGRTHDITMLRNQTKLFDCLKASGVFVFGDRGYQGLHHDIGILAVTPRKKTKDETEDDRYRRHVYNNGLSSKRIAVEHANGRMKWWRAMREWRRPADRFDRGGKAVGVLASIL